MGGAAAVTLPPLGTVYAVVVVITNLSVTVQLAVVFAVLPVAFSLLMFLQDTEAHFTQQDRRTLVPSLGDGCMCIPRSGHSGDHVHISLSRLSVGPS